MKSDYFYKDQILKNLMPAEGASAEKYTIQQLSVKLGLKPSIISYLLEDLNRDNYVVLTDLPEPDPFKFLAEISDNGIVFHNFGGYKKLIRREKWQLRWKITKTLTFGTNAIVIPLVVIWLLYNEFKEKEALNDPKNLQELETKEMLQLEKHMKKVREELIKYKKKDSLEKAADSLANKY